jgi:hypothetical protein
MNIDLDLYLELMSTLKHARIFISSREKMHPTGVDLYDRLVSRLAACHPTSGIKPTEDVPRPPKGRCYHTGPGETIWE